MANVIKPKRSYTATTVPTGLVAGEIAVNATDGKIWICNAAGTVNVLVSSLTRSDHTGTLAVASGGTGQITETAAFNALAPSQTSNSGKYLKTDGTNTSWGTLPSALPVLLYGGATTTNVAISNGSLPVLLFGGVTTVNVTVT